MYTMIHVKKKIIVHTSWFWGLGFFVLFFVLCVCAFSVCLLYVCLFVYNWRQH